MEKKKIMIQGVRKTLGVRKRRGRVKVTLWETRKLERRKCLFERAGLLKRITNE